MRIALIVPGGVDPSGEYRVIPALLALIERLARRHDVQVFALSQQMAPASWNLVGAKVRNIGAHRTRSRALRSILSEHRKARFDLIHSIWSGTGGVIAVAAARIARVPCIVHVAGGELAAVPAIHYGGALHWRGRVRERIVLRAASAVTAASAPVLDALAEIGVAARRIPLGVDLRKWPAREPVRRERSAPARLIHVGSLNPVKDQITLLHALDIVAKAGVSFEMTFVGEDTLAGATQALASRLGLGSKLTFTGFLTQLQLRPILEHAHLMIVSSRHETGPVAMLEAAIVGVPTVGTAVGHVAEWTPSAAVAVPVGDVTALAAVVLAVLGDEEQRLRIAREAARRAIEEDADYTAREVETLYQQLT